MSEVVDQKSRADLAQHETECEKRYGEILLTMNSIRWQIRILCALVPVASGVASEWRIIWSLLGG